MAIQEDVSEDGATCHQQLEQYFKGLAKTLRAAEAQQQRFKDITDDVHYIRHTVQEIKGRHRSKSSKVPRAGEELAQAGTAALEERDKHFVLRRCACGCGQMVHTDGDLEAQMLPPAGLRPSDDFSHLLPALQVDAETQRASVARLFERTRRSEQTVPTVQELIIAARPLDYARLEQLALPREEVKPRQEPFDQAALKKKTKTWKSRPEPAVEGLQLPPLRQSSRSSRSLPLPGLAQEPGFLMLLEHSAKKDWALPLTAGFQIQETEPQRAVPRTMRSQLSYVEERLYQKPSEAPNSIAALQKRLAALRQERAERECPA